MQQALTRCVRYGLRSLVLVFTLVVCFASAIEAQAPLRLRDRVFGASKRPVIDITVNGAPFHGHATFSEKPYVLWRAGERTTPLFPRDRAAAQLWLARAGRALGHRDFLPEYEETGNWRGDEVWFTESGVNKIARLLID